MSYSKRQKYRKEGREVESKGEKTRKKKGRKKTQRKEEEKLAVIP